MLRLLLSATPILFLAACGSPDARDTATVADSAGIRIVTSSSVDHPLPMRFTELRQIGGDDSGAAAFTDATVASVHSDGNDRIEVLDRDRGMIAVFDSTGAPVATFGRQGGGPGEFTMAFSLYDTGPDEIAVFDYAKRALVRWRLDGTVLPEDRLDGAVGGWNAMVRRGDATVLSLEESDSIRTRHRVVSIVAGDTTVLAELRTPPRRMITFDCIGLALAPLFSARFVVGADGDRLLVARQDRYEVDVYHDGRLVASVRRPIEAAPATEADGARMYPDGWTVRFGNGGSCTVPGPEVVEKAGMADRVPLIATVGFGPNGTIWVRRHTFPGDPKVSDVFDAEGTYLGTVNDRGLPLGWLGDDRILFPVEDSTTGVTRIGVFAVIRDAKGDDPST